MSNKWAYHSRFVRPKVLEEFMSKEKEEEFMATVRKMVKQDIDAVNDKVDKLRHGMSEDELNDMKDEDEDEDLRVKRVKRVKRRLRRHRRECCGTGVFACLLIVFCIVQQMNRGNENV